MRNILKYFSFLICAVVLAHASLQAKTTFTYAFQGDIKGVDPHALYETFQLATMSNVYEGLVAYNQSLKIVPLLAESYTNTEPNQWLIKLRKGVKFHNGNDFTAEDVLFTWERAKTTDLAATAKKIAKIEIKDDHTLVLHTDTPNPLLMRDLTLFGMMDKEWTTEHKADKPTLENEALYTNLHANGTGPFEVVSHQSGVKSVFKRFPGYWNNEFITTNVDEVVLVPIAQNSTRVAALLSGSVDLAYPIPLQDQKRVESDSKLKLLAGPETRSIFLGFDQERDELVGSNIKGKNPFKDQRVRAAFNYAIDVNLINKKIMRSSATPLGILGNKFINGYDPSISSPYEYDLARAKELMEEAGYPDGFTVVMDCPNNRYVNDEKICQAVSSMLAKIKVKVDLNAQPKNKYFAKVTATGNFDTSFYLLGWSPSSLDSHNIMYFLLSCRDTEAGVGLYNLGNYCNSKIDELTKKVQTEMDPKRRNAMIEEAFRIAKNDYSYVPLHAQALSWGVNSRVTVVQRANNQLDWREVVVNK